jgi:hypothetical protein
MFCSGNQVSISMNGISLSGTSDGSTANDASTRHPPKHLPPCLTACCSGSGSTFDHQATPQGNAVSRGARRQGSGYITSRRRVCMPACLPSAFHRNRREEVTSPRAWLYRPLGRATVNVRQNALQALQAHAHLARNTTLLTTCGPRDNARNLVARSVHDPAISHNEYCNKSEWSISHAHPLASSARECALCLGP